MRFPWSENKAAWLQSMFSSIARRYDLTNRVISFGLDERWRRIIAKRAASSGDTLFLDVATGTGKVAIQLARQLRGKGKIVGVDFTERMVAIGQEKVEVEKLQSQILFCVGDAQALPFVDEAFDGVVMVFGVRNFADPLRGLSEIKRVMKKGAKLFIVEFTWPQNCVIRPIYAIYFTKILPLIAWVLCQEKWAYRYLANSVVEFTQSNLSEMLEQVGFDDVKDTPLTLGVTSLYEATKKEKLFDIG
ncbi:MAG: bifunctional demethylmenaquinone methyltransferase/2-methoxy-6-polyprenyl-1,4-benzoquinol methylase UbiE [Candidatus Tectomicrobia bacterium]|nr:bifunctional demethylmenaquinone methyltransferase/2-methoxy-6-polyprenyl-1,4-benzoquinol methylase UbiE [Candidatus Tectomicrobia bacterium]